MKEYLQKGRRKRKALLLAGVLLCISACGAKEDDSGVNVGDVNVGDVNVGDVNVGDVNVGDVDAGDVSTGDVDAGDVSVGDTDAGDVSTGDVSVGDVDTGDIVNDGLRHIEIEIAGYEDRILCELDENAAPVTVQNFIKLAEDGFFDGLTFHRIVPDFVIQGGDPTGTGMGGSEENITGEFAVNGYDNPISHKRGVLSMARAGNDYNSASSQFFIVVADSEFLDGSYAAFGYVTEGMEIVDDIVANTPVQDTQSGYVAAENQPVITKITVLD